jgi:N-acetylglucosamine kinase-like BadF-type ATPase
MSDKIIIGVDGGGTKTQMAVADHEGKITGFSETGCTNWESEDFNMDNWLELFENLRGSAVETAVFTVSGWDYEEGRIMTKRNIEEAMLSQHVKAEKTIFRNDIYSLLMSGLLGSDAGVAVSSGTGTVGIARYGDSYYQTTAYGYIAGEWGSGPDMVEYALHLACASMLGRDGPFPILEKHAFKYFSVNDLDSLVKKIVSRNISQKEFGFFLSEIYEAYKEGCPGSRKVLEKAGHELALTTWSLLKKINDFTVPIIMGGGTIKNFGLPPGFKDRLKVLTGVRNEIRILKSDPVYGSLLWALMESGKPTDSVRKNIILTISSE